MFRNKLFISLIPFLLILNTVSAQTWVSAYYYSYIKISVDFTYKVTDGERFNFNDALALKTAQYNEAFNEVKSVYDEMRALQLLNKVNRNILNNYRDKYFDQIANQASKIDLSIPNNSSWAINNFRLPLTNNKNIRNEIKFMSKLGKEIDFIEHRAYLFTKDQIGDIEQKKKNITGFLSEFENSDPGSLNNLIDKYNLRLILLGESLE